MPRSLTRLSWTLGLLLGLSVGAWAAAAPPVPAAQGYVNDLAGALAPEGRARLEAIAASLEQSTGAELVFLIMPSIAPFDDLTYGMAVFDAWKIGKRGKDNGCLVLLALKERRVRIVTGYGLEPILPDGKLGRMRDEVLVPRMREGRIGEGLADLGLVMAQEIARAEQVELQGAAAERPKPRTDPKLTALFLFLGVLVFCAFLGQLARRDKRFRGGYFGGTSFGSGGGGFGGGFSGFGGGFSGGGGVGGSW